MSQADIAYWREHKAKWARVKKHSADDEKLLKVIDYFINLYLEREE